MATPEQHRYGTAGGAIEDRQPVPRGEPRVLSTQRAIHDQEARGKVTQSVEPRSSTD